MVRAADQNGRNGPLGCVFVFYFGVGGVVGVGIV